MPVAYQSFFVAYRLGNGLPQGDADVLDSMVRVNMQIAFRIDFQVDQSVTRDLVQHVVEKRHAGIEFRHASAIEIDSHTNLRFQRVADDFSLAAGRIRGGHGLFSRICFSKLRSEQFRQYIEESIVFRGRTDRDADAVLKHRVRTVQTLHENLSRLQTIENELCVWDTQQ